VANWGRVGELGQPWGQPGVLPRAPPGVAVTSQPDLFAAPASELGRRIPGSRYVDDFLTGGACQGLLADIDRRPWLPDLRRRVQHYGYRYDYKARKVSSDMYLGDLPAFLAPYAEQLSVPELFGRWPDQAIVNEYLPGQGISKHVDCVPCFGRVIASISLGSSCEMEFQHTETGVVEKLRLSPGSLLVLADEARYSWSHQIRARRSDGGVARDRRVSVTFRTVISGS
jgi:alkylated DNA repair dioxygenase AlkB